MLWFDRLSSSTHMPLNLGVVVIGLVPFSILFILGLWAAGELGSPTAQGLFYFTPIVLIVTAFAMISSRSISRETLEVVEYSRSLSADGATEGIRRLYGLTPVLVIGLMQNLLIQPIYFFGVLPSTLTLYQKVMSSIAFSYWQFPLATFVWVCAYSSYKTYKIGRRPLKLRRFTEDRTLGLRPFGRLALRITAALILLLSLIQIPQFFLYGFASAGVLLVFAAFIGLALILFFLPLLPLHSKLAMAKAEELSRISLSYTQLVEGLDVKRSREVETANEIIVIDKMQRDAHQIHSWPFDTSIIGRLLAILVSLVVILLSAYIKNVLPGLH